MQNPDGRHSDATLVDAFVRRGDERAFRSLYRRHGSRIAPMVLRLTGGDTHLAEDLLQETWLNACRAMPGFRRESSFSTWLTSIALNTVRDHYRRHRHDCLEVLEDTAIPAATPRDGADGIDLERALAQLPAGYRMVVVLHDIEGYRHREIAAALGLSAGTSKSQLTRARERLRTLLNPPREDRHATR